VERLNFHDPKTAPAVFDVVWCKWPIREARGVPGEVVRPVLVLDVRLLVDPRGGAEWAAITVAYGTGAENVYFFARTNHLVISEIECGSLGLHKATVFKMDLQNRQRLPWAEEYFVTQGYVRAQKLIAGSLNPLQQMAVRNCLAARGLQFPLP
jgi:hypothetical protein